MTATWFALGYLGLGVVLALLWIGYQLGSGEQPQRSMFIAAALVVATWPIWGLLQIGAAHGRRARAPRPKVES